MNLLISFPLAQAANHAAGSSWSMWVMLALIFVVMWFFMIRPQRKQQKEALKQSKCSMLLVDQSKFEKSGLCVWANPIQFQSILVDGTSTLKRKPKNVVVCQ